MKRLMVVVLLLAMVASGAGQAYAGGGCQDLAKDLVASGVLAKEKIDVFTDKCKMAANDQWFDKCKQKTSANSNSMIKYYGEQGCFEFLRLLLN